ncbi:hypothetical protein [Glutamicibacter ardleyensis]|uniref:hypothetical protein n=1 Tax=Glutamicibacter ardleyensis TaxID=225894 RepID=UPI003FCEF65F
MTATKNERREARRYEGFTANAHITIGLVRDSLPELTDSKKHYTEAEKKKAAKVFWTSVDKHLPHQPTNRELKANRKAVNDWIPTFFENYGTSEENWDSIVEALYEPEPTFAQMELDDWKDEDGFADFLIERLEEAGGRYWAKYKLARVYFDTDFCFKFAGIAENVAEPVGMKAFYDIRKSEFAVTGADGDTANQITDAFNKLRRELSAEYKEIG